MTAEQVLRCAILKQMHQFSYEKLAFHLADSQSFRAFCRLPYGFTPRSNRLPYYLLKPLLFAFPLLERWNGKYGMLTTVAQKG